ncbi:ROK family transcriptional regulator [Microbacterium saperdae]|uniref:Putative NBD/HSP70 family sugar kinase n=1 Tax=Microbacterium saperdae TaxID=69368 RepID=A0A543BAV5_9MICO|nr:ROK family transcriptional regulator [Microbacterium saperdae]TQL81979.1 putative NBD/HSP70 family sugar kinase [Microbacterium saperdae]GGM36264.1 ROK family protein [Microbacterium saperdae]
MSALLPPAAANSTTRASLGNTHAQGIRHRNRGLVLRTLMQHSVVSRADLARLTGLARPTISDLVKDLLDDGVLRESGQSQDARPGKPAVMLEFDQRAVQVIALDLSAPDHVAGALATPDGRLAHRLERPTAGDPVTAAAALVGELFLLASHPPLGVGIGVPSGSSALLGLGPLLAQTIDAPVHLFDDADLVADAELRFGDIDSDFLLVRLGARIGTAIRAFDDDGAPVERSTVARELAHVVAGGDPGDTCPCGRIGCVHAWASVPALSRRLDATANADRAAVLAAAGSRLGTSLSVIAAAVDLPTIVLSGPLPIVGDELIAATAAAVQAASHPSLGPVVRRSTLDDAVLQGAAARVVALAFSAR